MNLRLLSATLVLSASALHAGGFGGPPPFTNGSPLPTGTDGIYQAVARGKNLTGLFSFNISGGAQTEGFNANTWVFFVDGNVLSGQTNAIVSNDQVNGVLDSGTGGALPTNEDGSTSLPVVFVVPGNAASGFFNGDIDLNSPIASFEGHGALQGTPERTDQIVFIYDPTDDVIIVDGEFDPVTVTPVVIPGSDFNKVEFEFRGTRVSTSPASTTTTTTASN